MAQAAQREEKSITMTDGRIVLFVGKRKLLKDTLIDPAKVAIAADGSVTLAPGAVAVRLDFVNGATRTWTPPSALIAKSIGHGLEQKTGDEIAGTEDVEDCVEAVDDLLAQLDKGEWTSRVAGAGGFNGAHIVIRALVQVAKEAGKELSIEKVKEFLNAKLESATAKGEKLSRKDLYDSFRKPGTKTGDAIAKLEAEKVKKSAKVDADAELAALMA